MSLTLRSTPRLVPQVRLLPFVSRNFQEAELYPPAAALQVGKIKNKVLKLTGEVQQIKIKIAQAAAAGESTASLETSLATETCVSIISSLLTVRSY
jgi:hypothetical protein